MESILLGFSVCLLPVNLLSCFIGTLVGTLIGVLPGIGPVATMALLLPLTFGLSPVSAVIMLAGIYYGAQYGGSTTSILVNIPGEATSVMTCVDGYQMARQGRAGPALGIAAFGSFIAGMLGVAGTMLFARPLSTLALQFGPAEYCSLIFASLMLVGYLGGGSLLKSSIMALVGLLIGSVGSDMVTLAPRFTFGISEFDDGIGMAPILIGLFGVAEVLDNLEEIGKQKEIVQNKVKNILPSLRDWKESIGSILRGFTIGFPLGLIPGGGALIPTFVSYAVEKKVSKHPENFGHGAIQGVAGPESANNAGAQGAFIPLLCLGIPSNAIMAILLGALMIHGVKIGPLLLSQHPDIFWGVLVSMFIGNVMLLVLNIPLIPLWVSVLRMPYSYLFPLIILLCLVGTYSINSSLLDLVVMIIFGVAGYWMRKHHYPPTSLVMGLILSPILEETFRQAMILFQGRISIFVTRPISAVFLMVGLAIFCITVFPWTGSKLKSLLQLRSIKE